MDCKTVHSRVKIENGLERVLVKILVVGALLKNGFANENVHSLAERDVWGSAVPRLVLWRSCAFMSQDPSFPS